MRPASSLHRYITEHHWDGRALTGPDSGIRFNYRAGRFIKSYTPAIRWNDDYYYLQAQGYWILANWRLFERTAREEFRTIAMSATDEALERRRPDGAWDYPNPEWGGRIATAEGTWAALGLMESFRRTGEPRVLEAAARWHDYVESSVGYMTAPGGIAVRYFAGRQGRGTPVANNSAFVLRFLAELAATGTPVREQRCRDMLSFLRAVQRPGGELPYAVSPDNDPKRSRIHFQCFQYNAFQCIDLLIYHQLTGDTTARSIASGVCRFLQQGVAADGRVYYDCRRGRHTVVYHAAAVAAALSLASDMGVSDGAAMSRRVYDWVVSRQREDGGFDFSYHAYGFLTDRRSYPRNLAMILLHLLLMNPPAG